MSKQITSKETNYSQWYLDVIREADLAENSAVRGSMILKPYGYSIWENIKNAIDHEIKKDPLIQNAYFPLLIPKSYLSREAAHIKGFAKECAIVTHYRLKNSPNGEEIIIDPDAKLEEEFIIRPTSETIIWESFKNWIKSYRDLPLKINQWANIMRWEMRTRMFLRTSEILWQEGHTAHSNFEEAQNQAKFMINLYSDILNQYLAIPCVIGTKTETEKFAGADTTYTVEIMTQDKKALQAGTSHFLGENFSKSFDVKYSDKDGKLKYPYGTSWGLTTRLIGALIMVHADNNGLILPPNIAPIQVVIIPIYKSEEELNIIKTYIFKILDKNKNKFKFFFDDRSYLRPGWKFSHYEVKGVPIRLTIGLRDVKQNTIEVYRRDTKEKEYIERDKLIYHIEWLLKDIHKVIKNKALDFRACNIHEVNTFEEFKEIIKTKKGFISAHWDGDQKTEEEIKKLTKATIRCIPFKHKYEKGNCIKTGKESKQRVIFAEAY